MTTRRFFLDIQEEIEGLKEQGYKVLNTPSNLWIYKKIAVVNGEPNPQLLVLQKQELQKREQFSPHLKITTVIVEQNSLGILDILEQSIPLPSSSYLLFEQEKNKKK